MALVEPQNPPKPHKFDNFIGRKYELAVNESIQSLLDSLHMPISNLSVFSSTFLELMQAKPDPPLETIWVSSALSFRSNNSPKDEPLDKFLAMKDSFQSITTCSASCSSSKSIALISPVIYELYGLVVDLKLIDVGSKGEKKVRREIRSFLDVILAYINVCCCEGTNGDEGLNLIRPLIDLVHVWIEDEVVGNGGGNEGIRLFFPLLSDQIIEWLSNRGCSVSELAGVVIAETFLLRLCLKFGVGSSREDLQNELRTWAVASITGFGNFHFFDVLVKMLLEPTLPVTSLLCSEDEIFLRKILYDAVILPEYSFLHPDRVAHLTMEHVKSIAVARLMVTHEAVELFRRNGDHTKAISCINAFSGSHLPSQLIKWVKNDIGMAGKSSGPNGSSPQAFLKWLLNLADQGIRLFDDVMSKYRARLILDSLKADYEQPAYKAGGKKSDDDLLFFIDNKGKEDGDEEDEKTNESISAVFVAAAHTMQSVEHDGGRKRKERRGAEKQKQVKFHKVELYYHSGSSEEKTTFFGKDGSSSESEVENPRSEEDMEVKEQ